MTTFDSGFLAEQKNLLEQRQTELLKELNIDAVPRPNTSGDFEARFPDYGDKDDDSAAEVATFQNNLSLEKELEVSLFNVKKALRKIEEGNYGLCEKCSQPIEIDRLKAFPSATSCMDCKRKGL